MPARSTFIQRVIFQIQHQLAPEAIVEESAFLADRFTGQRREVDVVLRSRVGSHEVIVAVECREHRRRADIEWVEQMAMKHSSLPTSKLVLVSLTGFTRSASVKAASFGVDADSFAQAGKADWAQLVGGSTQASFSMWAFRIVRCSIILASDDSREYFAPPATRIYRATGEFRGTLGDVVRPEAESAAFTENAIEYAEKAGDEIIGAELRIRPPLFAEREDGERHEVAAIRVYLQASKLPSAVRLTTARLNDLPVAYGRGESPAGSFTLSIIKPDADAVSGAFSVVDPVTGAVQTVGVRVPSAAGRLAFLTDRVRVRLDDSAV